MKKTRLKAFMTEESEFQHIESSYGEHKKSIEDILKLPDPSVETFESRFKIGLVYFDNSHGLGSVSDNRNVDYKGFVAMLTPKQFLELAADHGGQREDSATDMKTAILDGYPLGSPFLEIVLSDIEEGGYATIVGHEGRARCLALLSLAKEGKAGFTEATKIPVHFFLRDGMRSRHITDEMIDSIRHDGIIPEDHRRKNPKDAEKVKIIKEIYVNGKKIEL